MCLYYIHVHLLQLFIHVNVLQNMCIQQIITHVHVRVLQVIIHVHDVIRDVERKKERHLRQWKNEK